MLVSSVAELGWVEHHGHRRWRRRLGSVRGGLQTTTSSGLSAVRYNNAASMRLIYDTCCVNDVWGKCEILIYVELNVFYVTFNWK